MIKKKERKFGPASLGGSSDEDREVAKTDSRSKTSSPTRGAARRFWASFPPITIDVGRQVPAQPEEDAQSEASEWGLRERREREEGRRRGAEELGGEEQPLFLAMPSLMASAEEE